MRMKYVKAHKPADSMWTCGSLDSNRKIKSLSNVKEQCLLKHPQLSEKKLNTLYCVQKCNLKSQLYVLNNFPRLGGRGRSQFDWRNTWLPIIPDQQDNNGTAQWRNTSVSCLPEQETKQWAPRDSSAWNRMVRDLLFRSRPRGISRATKVQGSCATVHSTVDVPVLCCAVAGLCLWMAL